MPLSVFLSWGQDDQDAALAYEAWEAARCHTCGTHPDDLAAATYVGAVNVHCAACAAVEDHAKQYSHLEGQRAYSFAVRLLDHVPNDIE